MADGDDQLSVPFKTTDVTYVTRLAKLHGQGLGKHDVEMRIEEMAGGGERERERDRQ